MTGPVRHVQHYTPEQRATMAASHRQRRQIAETFWTHPALPGVAFTTRREALRAASDKGATS